VGEAFEAVIDGRPVRLSNLDKVFYPETGFTKAHVIEYYRRIAPVLLPHLRGRPVTLKRYPDGVEGPFFYEKSCPDHAPEWVRTAPIWSEGRGDDIWYCLLDDLPSLVWAANLADLELHTFLHLAEDDTRPCFLAFDLDPGAPAGILQCARVALRVRGIFGELGLDCHVKTSGSKGMQVYVPLNTDVTYEETKPFARAIAEALERDDPDLVTSNMRKDLRKGKIFVDWSQNDDHKTTVCAYSLRAKARPTVSTPLEWDEVERALATENAEGLSFEAAEVVARVERKGDLFADVLTREQALPALG
jgi:bifunctional non-homologous end joining protein LigD